MKRSKAITNYEKQHRPIPEPPERSLVCGLVYLAASFFNNTRSVDFEHYTRDSRSIFRYRGLGHDEYHNKNRRRRHKRRRYKEC